MAALATLRAPIDRFFEEVIVNADEADKTRQPPCAAWRFPRCRPPGRGFQPDRGVISLAAPVFCPLSKSATNQRVKLCFEADTVSALSA
jgi:hypothetical protein